MEMEWHSVRFWAHTVPRCRMLKLEKIKSCSTDRDEGGCRDVFSAEIICLHPVQFLADEAGQQCPIGET